MYFDGSCRCRCILCMAPPLLTEIDIIVNNLPLRLHTGLKLVYLSCFPRCSALQRARPMGDAAGHMIMAEDPAPLMGPRIWGSAFFSLKDAMRGMCSPFWNTTVPEQDAFLTNDGPDWLSHMWSVGGWAVRQSRTHTAIIPVIAKSHFKFTALTEVITVYYPSVHPSIFHNQCSGPGSP